MTEDKGKPVVGWRPSKEARELLDKLKGEDRAKLLNKLAVEELKRQRELSASECEQMTLEQIKAYEHGIDYYLEQLAEYEKKSAYDLVFANTRQDFEKSARNEINWFKWWINHMKTTCLCGAKRGHKPEEQGDFQVKKEWIQESKSYGRVTR